MEIVGWSGAITLIAAYAWRTLGDPSPLWYHALNLLGAIGIATQSARKRAYPPVVLNLFWALVACAGLGIALLGLAN